MRWLRGKSSDRAATSAPRQPTSPPDPEQAWKALGLVIDWVKHAEAKAGATLAATGLTGGVLYRLMSIHEDPGVWVEIFAGLCAVLTVCAGMFAAIALWPRLRSKEDPTSVLFFNHIARKHRDSLTTYVQTLITLTTDHDSLVKELAQQIWANSLVATAKYKWGSRAIACLLLAIPMLAVTSVLAIEPSL